MASNTLIYDRGSTVGHGQIWVDFCVKHVTHPLKFLQYQRSNFPASVSYHPPCLPHQYPNYYGRVRENTADVTLGAQGQKLTSNSSNDVAHMAARASMVSSVSDAVPDTPTCTSPLLMPDDGLTILENLPTEALNSDDHDEYTIGFHFTTIG